MNKKEKKLIGALIGLAKACNVHLKTENTDGIIIKSLASIFPLEENGEELLQRVREEKLAVAPDCATCFAPCGNTDEYNLDELQASGISETIRDLKFQLLNVSHEIASGMVSYTINSTEENIVAENNPTGTSLDNTESFIPEQAFDHSQGANAQHSEYNKRRKTNR